MSHPDRLINHEQPGQKFTPVPETYGTISKIFVNLRPPDSELLGSELAIVEALAREIPGVEIVLGVVAGTEDTLKNIGLSHPSIYFRPENNRGTWARDIGFWADDGRTFVVNSGHPTRVTTVSAEVDVVGIREAETFRQALNINRLSFSPFSAEWGDILFTANHAFVGFATAGQPQHFRNFSRVIAPHLHVLGNSEVGSPPAHLDTALIPATDDIFIINDPRSLYDIVSRISNDEWFKCQSRFAAKIASYHTPLMFGCRPIVDISHDVIRDLANISQPGTFGHDSFSRSLPGESALMAVIKNQLRSMGKTLIELPGMEVLGFPFSPVNSLIDTYFENSQLKRRIFVPTYGLPTLDTEVLKRLQQSHLFAKIIPIEVGWELNLQRGGLRCVVNALRHTSPPSFQIP